MRAKVKHELEVRSYEFKFTRVTSSNPRVRKLKARVRRLKARVEAIKLRVA